jgi:ABC-type nitrate/sulfonate/bicarbonate transport system ATPase subunit
VISSSVASRPIASLLVKAVPAMISVGLLLLAWELYATYSGIKPTTLPAPSRVFEQAMLNREALADEYAALVGLKGFENNFPHELSGGMLKRAEIARALVVKPEILYMDEPFSALDALMSLRMQNELLRILGREKHTVMLITHDVEEAIHVADRVLVLSPRPARIQASFDVPFADPRKLSSPQAQALRVAILKELGVEETV